MKSPTEIRISSRDNSFFKSLRKLVHNPASYRKYGKIWLEGDHLCQAALARNVQLCAVVFSLSFWKQGPAPAWFSDLSQVHILDDALFAQLSALESSGQIGYVLDAGSMLQKISLIEKNNTVILDRIQDAGNVGSILRSASALGFKQIIALPGTAALWSPKVLRAGMGAHFDLNLFEGCSLSDIDSLQVPLLVTHLQGATLLHQTELPNPCAWVLGHEGQGVAEDLRKRADFLIRIAQPGGEDSLNVAAAAAICMHASATFSGSAAAAQV